MSGFLVLLCAAQGFAAPRKANPETVEKASTSGSVLLPFVAYRPETNLAGGVIHLAYFQLDPQGDTKRPSSLRTLAMGSLSGMIFVQLLPELFWDSGRFRLNGELLYQSFPDRFYGIGPATSALLEERYTISNPRVRLNLRRRLWQKLEAGPAVEWEGNKITKTEPGGELATQSVPGATGGTIMGVGAIVSWDTRDALFFPTRGGYYEGTVTSFLPGIGSDFAFTRTRLDFRRFQQVLATEAGPHVLAFQGVAQLIQGQPPFNQYSLLGGHRLMRAYWEGRYRDLNFAAAQLEYRASLFRRFGGIVFGGAGNVFSGSDVLAGGLKSTYGIGLRYAADVEQRINIRLDLAGGRDAFNFYLQLGESF